ncbi:MAG: DUF2207 domain-containing protein [Devosia sp.]|nr:DUF2207 domain-containing protein [Devosia sp.]
MSVLRRLLLAVLVFAGLTLPALAAEQITAFDSHVVLDRDGTVEVTEAIGVNAEGDRIRHGIFRDIFTVLRNADGSKFYATLSVTGVTRDGQAEPYTTEGINNGERIRIGSADTYVDPGPHVYSIHYTMTRMARFFPDHDELYWNATGNFWDFPILRATATIELPKGAVISNLAAYTGPVGSTAQAATITRTGDTIATFSANNPLSPGEGMTIAAAFQKGIVTPPAGAGQGIDWLSDHREAIVPLAAVLIVLLYNFWAWSRVGRDPKKGTIFPLFHPPEGLSPAATQWVHRMGFKGNGWNAFTAGIFDLGVKGLVTIDNADKTLTVTASGRVPAEPLPADEQVLYDYFGGKGAITVDRSNGPTLDKKRQAMLAAITKSNTGAYFHNNIGYSVVGVLIAAACLAIMVWLEVLDPGWLIAAVVGGVVIGGIVAMFRGGLGKSPFGFIFGLIWFAIFGANALGALGRVASADLPIHTPAIAALSLVLVTVIFAFIMRAPTVAGRKLMDQIDGFIMYLNTAEKNRLNIEGEPPMTIKRFEAILPFAIALGVEKPWSDKFNAALAAGQVSDATGVYYAPLWYSGRDFSDSRSLSNNIAAISSGMAAAMASAVPAQSSSSGFSGGGSSGGGGGGGGGGGW